MIIHPLPIIFGLSLLTAACDFPFPDKQEKAGMESFNDGSPVIATANRVPITEEMLNFYQAQTQPSTGDKEALEQLIDLELARQDGEKRNFDKNNAIQLQLYHHRRVVLAAAAAERQLLRHPISEEEVKALYDESSLASNQYKVRHILVKDENEANILIAELDKGADFSELARRHSADPSGNGGGNLGWLSTRQMSSPFSAILPYLRKGEFTRQPFKSKHGWNIIILDDVREGTLPAFEQIETQLRTDIRNQRLHDYRNKLRRNANIEIMQPPASASSATASDAEGRSP